MKILNLKESYDLAMKQYEEHRVRWKEYYAKVFKEVVN